MDWIKPDSLATVAGASLAVTLAVAAVKVLLPSITGRATQVVALVCSLIIAAAIGTFTSPVLALVSLLNGLVIFAASMGIDQAVNYEGGRS